MPADRLRGWLVTILIALVGGILRFWNLGFPTDRGTPVFDEKHYVPQAWQVLRNGGYEDNPGFELVVHPPLGKHLIALGEWLFGYNGWGWRFTAAVAGTIMIILIIRIARRLTRSTMLGAIAGILLICDGVSHLMSRMGMLDIFQAAFVLAAFAALLVDRDQVRSRLAQAVREGWVNDTRLGPSLGWRWWRFTAGVMLGLACGVKWSGAFYLVAFAALTICWDHLARRAAGVRDPLWGTLRRDAAPLLWAFVLLPVLVYLSTWIGWFASETGTDRHVVGTKVPEGGTFGFVPDALRGLWYYSSHVLEFHSGLVTGADGKPPHSYESKPWSWPMGLRPMLYYWNDPAPGCLEGQRCVAATMLIGTPAMWWLSFPMLGWALWRALTNFDWRYAAILVGYGAGWLPWFHNIERQMYYFYATPMAPFLILGLTMVLGEILGSARATLERRNTGLLVVSLYIGIVVTNFAWLWPVLMGDSITQERWNAELWLPSWR